MRLIDADRLKDEVLKWLPSDPCGVEEKEMPYETDIVVSMMLTLEDAPTIKTKQVKYFDDDENVWKIGSVIVNSSEKPNNCDTCRFELYCPEMCEGCCEWDSHYESKDEPQTEREGE